MRAINTILTLVIGIAIGAVGYHLILKIATSRASLQISHSNSDPGQNAMESFFADEYARRHRAKDLPGLMAMGKFDGVWENIISSKKANFTQSFSQEITEFSFRELAAAEISGLSDLSLPPVLEYKISFAQPNPEVDRMQAYIGFLGAEAGRLYMVDRLKKE